MEILAELERADDERKRWSMDDDWGGEWAEAKSGANAGRGGGSAGNGRGKPYSSPGKKTPLNAARSQKGRTAMKDRENRAFAPRGDGTAGLEQSVEGASFIAVEELPSPTLVTYNSAMAACARNGRWIEALQLLHAARRRGVAPDVVTFTAAISACARARPPKYVRPRPRLLLCLPQPALSSLRFTIHFPHTLVSCAVHGTHGLLT